jgi:hypothetical protein
VCALVTTMHVLLRALCTLLGVMWVLGCTVPHVHALNVQIVHAFGGTDSDRGQSVIEHSIDNGMVIAGTCVCAYAMNHFIYTVCAVTS